MTAESDTRITENADSIHVEQPDDSSVNVLTPLLYIDKSEPSSSSVNCLLILNQEIRLPTEFFTKLWNNASVHFCADGGTNRLYDYMGNLRDKYIPEFIVGDLDSLRDDVRSFYQSHGSQIKQQQSQYYSDLDKSISLINLMINFPDTILTKLNDYSEVETVEAEKCRACQSKQILVTVVGGIGGRFDQTIATISRTLQSTIARKNITFLLLNSEHAEFVILVPKGANYIDYPIDAEVGFQDPERSRRPRNIGVLPLSEPSIISTKGLKWDIKDWKTELSGDLSLCNYQVGDSGFYIKSNKPIFLNIEF